MRDREELDEVRRFRYQIYVRELGKQLPTADHAKGLLVDPWDYGAEHFICRVDDDVVGTTRLHVGPSIPPAAIARAGATSLVEGVSSPLAYMSKLMIAPDARGGSALTELLAHSYRAARDLGVLIGFSHCAPRLVPFYRRLGLREFGIPFTDPHVGAQVPLVLVLEDEAHMDATRSPLRATVAEYQNDARRADGFNTLLFGARLAMEAK